MFESHKDEVEQAYKEAIERGLEIIGGKAESYAKGSCPVDTGNLRNSITHEVGDGYVEIGSAVEYAPFVELGTVHMAARPYLTPAAESHGSEYENVLKMELNNVR